MGVKVEDNTCHLEVNNTFQRPAILVPDLFSQISFDCGGTQDSRTTSPSAPEAASTIETATHGFSIVTAADGQRAVQFIKTRDDGTAVTYQLCEGARSIEYEELAKYGNDKLEGAKLGTDSEFEEMVDALFRAVKGLRVADGELQTQDEVLKLAYKIVQEGVRTKRGSAEVKFLTEDKDGGPAVSGCRVSSFIWGGTSHRYAWAFFGVSSPEPK